MLHRLFIFNFILSFFPGKQFNIFLFILLPFESAREDGNENNDENQCQKKDTRIKVGSEAYHFRPFIPSGEEVDNDRDNE